MKTIPTEREIAQTMGQAATLLGVELSEVKRAKRAGCDAFLRSGRVDVGKLREWLLDNPAGVASARAPAVQEPGNEIPLAPVDLSTVEASLRAAVSVEESLLRLFRVAEARGDAIAASAASDGYARAQKNRLATEAVVMKQQLERGTFITMHSHRMEMNRMWVPFLTALRALPPKLAIRLVGLDDIASERLLAESIEGVFAEVQKIAVGSEDEMRVANLGFWMRSILMEDPSGNVLFEKVREVLVGVERLVAEKAAPPTR